MKKKYLVLLIVTIILSSVLLSACGGDKAGNFFAELDASTAENAAAYDKIANYYSAATAYTYTVDLYSETLSNFDSTAQMMPNDKTDGTAERKKWSKPSIVYTYTKVDGDWYVKVEYTAPKLDEKGYPTYRDSKFKKPLYEDTVVGEYWFVSGVFTAKTNQNVVYSGQIDDFDDTLAVYNFDVENPDIAKEYLSEFEDVDTFKNAVFQTVHKNIFGKEVVTFQNFFVATADALTPYRDSDKAAGYSEDLRFVWKDILGASNRTVCVSAKKEKLVKLEVYSEYFASYNKTTTQIWDGQTVTNWYGDRIAATKAVIEIDYGSKKHPISISAL